MQLSEIIKARGRGALVEFGAEMSVANDCDYSKSTMIRWKRECRVEPCGSIYWIKDNKLKGVMSLTPAESQLCMNEGK